MAHRDPEKRRAYNAAYRAARREELNTRERERARDPIYKEKHRKYRKANLSKYAEYQRNSRAKNPKDHLIYQARMRATRDALPFGITDDTMHWPTHCPVLGLELDYSKAPIKERREAWQVRSNTVTLDRHVNALGYVVGNVFAISHRANRIKSDATAEELMAVAVYARDGLPNS